MADIRLFKRETNSNNSDKVHNRYRSGLKFWNRIQKFDQTQNTKQVGHLITLFAFLDQLIFI